MRAVDTLRTPLRVVAWPRITAAVHPDGTGTLTINGTSHPCAAPSVDELRTGMVARCVTVADALHRPVRLTVTEADATWPLAVRPEGVVQLLNDDGTLDPPDGLAVDEGRCRTCRHLQPVTSRWCTSCGTKEPHRVEVMALDVADVLPSGLDVAQLAADPEPAPPAQRPALRLTFTSQAAVTVTENVAIGRNPAPVDGRQPLAVHSPERMLSRTHALVDVDAAGQILVTDYHSGNGIEAQSEPPTRLTPGLAYIVQPGTTLLMGDVACTLDLAADTPSSHVLNV